MALTPSLAQQKPHHVTEEETKALCHHVGSSRVGIRTQVCLAPK